MKQKQSKAKQSKTKHKEKQKKKFFNATAVTRRKKIESFFP
jgi:hypothetical protein